MIGQPVGYFSKACMLALQRFSSQCCIALYVFDLIALLTTYNRHQRLPCLRLISYQYAKTPFAEKSVRSRAL